MKSAELKKVLKPLIKECVKEMMIEEGFLSSVVSEVIKGMNANVIVENTSTASVNSREDEWRRSLEEKMELERQQRIQKLNESMSKQHNVDVFEGVNPIMESGTTANSSHSALAGQDPNDAGVDISGIMGIAGGKKKWKALTSGGSNV